MQAPPKASFGFDRQVHLNDYGRLLAPVLAGKANAVFGSRFSGETRRVFFFWHAVGNHILNLISNMFNNLNLTDMETCYKLFGADVLRQLTIEQNRFGFEPEITAKIATLGVRLYETPIS
jgi:hypothetical protein